MAKVTSLHDALRFSRPGSKAVPIDDIIFFKKEQLKIGMSLKYYGRHRPGTTWEVVGIWYFPLVRGQYRRHKVDTVVTLQDQIDVVCKETGQHMELTFQYLSYSAIWRLQPTGSL